MIIPAPPYLPPRIYRNKDINTIVPALFRKVGLQYKRVRMETPDGDYIDLDFSKSNQGHRGMVILTHGLEGGSRSPYMEGMARALNQVGLDTVAFNLRNCSGEPNRLYNSYHSGSSADLALVVEHVLKTEQQVEDLYLVGFSLGGNITLKYLGEQGVNIDPRLKSAVAVSVPVDLHASCLNLQRSRNWIYLRRFTKTLKRKTLAKKKAFPEADFEEVDIHNIKGFIDFDNLYTAPAHGFKNAVDYYQRCSSKQFLARITIPTLLINAQDDPFLTPDCFPIEIARNHPYFNLMIPTHGGHVGFIPNGRLKGNFWHEDQTAEFLQG